MTPILSVRNLSTGYGKKQVLFGVSLDVMPGEILLISGGNGSGKSTLLKAIYGLLPPWNADAKISFCPNSNGPAFKTHPPTLNLSKGLAYLPQKNAVFDDFTVEDNLRLSGDSLHDRKSFTDRRDEALIAFPALQSLLHRKPERLSGGERQMVALAMGLLHRPKLLLLDEPTAGLDLSNADLVLQSLRRSHVEMQMAIVVVEHRLHECAALGGRLFRMKLGKLAAELSEYDAAPVE